MNRESHDERQFAYKVSHALTRGAENLDADIRDRLKAARNAALSRQRIAGASFSPARIGRAVAELLLPQARTLAALLTLCIAVLGSYYWNNYQQAVENAEIDSALLADDLPINAYLDHGFRAWLEYPSSSLQ